MTYDEAKAMRDRFEQRVSAASDALQTFEHTAIGLTIDRVKFSVEFQAAKKAYDAAFNNLRAFNATFTRMYAKDIRKERRTT